MTIRALSMVIGVALALGVAGTDVRASPRYETPVDRAVATTLPPELAKGPYHRVRDPILADGYMLHFTAESPFGTFEVTGLGALRKLVRELSAIAELRNIKGTEAWAKQVADSGTSSLQFVGKLLTHPVDTMSGLPKGMYKGVEAVGASVAGPRDPSNGRRLAEMQIPSSLATRYLDHPHFTPRHDTILVEALSRLGAARGRDVFLTTALAAEDEADANFYVAAAQMLRGYHETVSPVTEIRRVNALVVARTASGRLFVPAPLDTGLWTQRSDQATDAMRAAAGAPEARIDFWVMGTVTPRAGEQLAARGFDVVEHANRRVEIID